MARMTLLLCQVFQMFAQFCHITANMTGRDAAL